MKRDDFLRELAKMLEVESLTPESPLENWDSLNVMGAVVLIDDCFGKVVHGRQIAECRTVADLLRIAEGS